MPINMTFSRFSDYFIAVAKTGSLRKAADQLYISVSAIHRQIALAEEEFGIDLFERLPNGLKLTLAGELLYADLIKWQKEFQLTRNRFDEIQGLSRGTIDCGLITALSDGFVLDSIQYMYENYPWINFNFHIQDSEKVSNMIMDAEIDFGILLNPKGHHQLEVLAFVEIPIGFVLPKAHPLTKTEKIHLSDTLNDQHLIPSAPLIIQDYVQTLYKHYQLAPQHQLECNDIRMIMSLIQKNLGIGLLSYIDVYPYLEQDELCFKPIREKGLYPLTLALCVAPKRQLSRVSQVMIKHLIEQIERFKLKLIDYQ
ncbi:DNA-binding transcriptional LysR family regulator [Acinetobacter bereziniae]|uniref:LysR family transcriptional regulator n=1 Tax=Acinetobacter bereziniae TaxID=106648 RepID=UPI00285C2B01|nr:LysR family transcriptional regulator [Acinetobacter bereziniae]MDR6543052.1 DNA-binding transcriptional LysR family regulator [Acinetobacter bereziniae]